ADVARGFRQRVGEGFAGTVAAERKPVLLREGSASPVVKSRHLRERGLRVIYGVPLVHGESVIGVAHMGSQTAREFSEQDQLILRTMAMRATALIVQHEAREAVRQRRAPAPRRTVGRSRDVGLGPALGRG